MNVPALPPGPVDGLLAGVDIGGTTTRVVLCGPGLGVECAAEVPTPAAHGGAAMTRAAFTALDTLLDGEPRPLAGIGFGAAGVVDRVDGRILVASDSFSGWAGFGVTDAAEAALGVPAFLDNDVNAFLRGEVAHGAAVGERHVLGMTLGTGVGGALWIDGALYDGPHGAAGEIGHVPGFGDLHCSCGGRGHLETLAAGRAITAGYARRTGRVRSAQEIADAAVRGDQDAAAVYERAGAAVARALLITAGVLDVTTAVLGGGVSDAWTLLEPAIRAAVAEEPPVSGRPLRVVPSRLGRDAVAVGAAAHALTELGAAVRTP
ncbi:ROK family protein [Streptomyces sp. NPDC050560]|uniref:ROK family protein n=1 Tax=Streptomyces sp. NPDC050560 TaxID=3365630 RepID=UPI0037BBE4F4